MRSRSSPRTATTSNRMQKLESKASLLMFKVLRRLVADERFRNLGYFGPRCIWSTLKNFPIISGQTMNGRIIFNAPGISFEPACSYGASRQDVMIIQALVCDISYLHTSLMIKDL